MFIKLLDSFLSKPVAIVLACSMVLMSFTTVPSKDGVVVLKAGTPVHLEIMSAVNSNNSTSGQIVDFRVLQDVKADGVVVIPAGAIAKGQIVSAKKNGLLGVPGKIAVAVRSVQAVDGTMVNLSSTTLTDEGQDKLAASIVFTVLCIFGFLIKGGEGEIANASMMQASVLSNTEIAVEK